MTEEYTYKDWNEDKIFVATLIARRERKKAKEHLNLIFQMTSDNHMPHVHHYVLGALFILEITHPENDNG